MSSPEVAMAKLAHALRELQRSDAAAARLERTVNGVELTFHDAAGGQTAGVKLTDLDLPAAEREIASRLYLWPDISDELFGTGLEQTKRYLQSPPGQPALSADVQISTHEQGS